MSVAPGLVPDVDETRQSRESPRAEENYPPAAWEGDESRILITCIYNLNSYLN